LDRGVGAGWRTPGGGVTAGVQQRRSSAPVRESADGGSALQGRYRETCKVEGFFKIITSDRTVTRFVFGEFLISRLSSFVSRFSAFGLIWGHDFGKTRIKIDSTSLLRAASHAAARCLGHAQGAAAVCPGRCTPCPPQATVPRSQAMPPVLLMEHLGGNPNTWRRCAACTLQTRGTQIPCWECWCP
jgi:hypothetical protein